MHLPEPIKKWLPTALIAGTAGALTYFASRIVAEASAPFWQHVAPAISQTLLLSLCCFLSLVLLIAVAWIVFLNRSVKELKNVPPAGPTEAELARQFHDQFGDFVEQAGVWKHKTKAGYYCSKCKVNLIESRMAIDPTQGICPVCTYIYYH